MATDTDIEIEALNGMTTGELADRYAELHGHPHRGIVDLKTCDDLTWFEADARRYRYVNQMAFYRAVLAACLGKRPAPVHVIAIEKKEPYRCGVWRVADDALAIAQQENEAAIHRLALCRQRDHWPTGYEGIRVLEAA